MKPQPIPAALILGLGLLGAGCGSTDPVDESGVPAISDVETSGDGSSSGRAEESRPPSDDPGEAALAFAQCMRDNGIDLPDPEIGADDVFVGRQQATPLDEADFEAAADECRPLLSEGGSYDPPGEAEQAEMEQRMLDMAQCMRDHGIEDFPDPEFSGDGMVTMAAGEGVDPNDPVFQDAMEACGTGIGPGAPTDGDSTHGGQP